MKYKIQEIVVKTAKNYEPGQSWHLNQIRLEVALSHEISLSYKQTRDAFYRVRTRIAITHRGNGYYAWDF